MANQIQDDFMCSTGLSSLPVQIFSGVGPSISVSVPSDPTLIQVTVSYLLTLMNNK